MKALLTPEETIVAAAAAARITREQVAEALEAQEWTFAKTMPQIPHFWVIKRRWAHSLPWDDVIAAMAAYSRPMRWRTSTRLYFDAGEWRYWWMDPTLPQVDLLNRQLLSISECRPVKPRPQPAPQLALDL